MTYIWKKDMKNIMKIINKLLKIPDEKNKLQNKCLDNNVINKQHINNNIIDALQQYANDSKQGSDKMISISDLLNMIDINELQNEFDNSSENPQAKDKLKKMLDRIKNTRIKDKTKVYKKLQGSSIQHTNNPPIQINTHQYPQQAREQIFKGGKKHKKNTKKKTKSTSNKKKSKKNLKKIFLKKHFQKK